MNAIEAIFEQVELPDGYFFEFYDQTAQVYWRPDDKEYKRHVTSATLRHNEDNPQDPFCTLGTGGYVARKCHLSSPTFLQDIYNGLHEDIIRWAKFYLVPFPSIRKQSTFDL